MTEEELKKQGFEQASPEELEAYIAKKSFIDEKADKNITEEELKKQGFEQASPEELEAYIAKNKFEDNFTPVEDATTTRSFKQVTPVVENDMLIDKSLSPQEIDTKIALDNKAMLVGNGEDYENKDIDFTNIGKGLIERGNTLVVNTLNGAQSIVDYSENQFGTSNTKLLKKLADWSKGTLGYKPIHDENELKEAYKKGGLLDIDTIQEGFLYGAEQLGKSIPDMGAIITLLPLYIFSRTKEMADDRAKNDGRKEGNVHDMAKSAPFVVASVYLDRLGLKATTSDILEKIGKDIIKKGWKNASKDISKEIAKGSVKEATTEFIQEGIIEPTGERVGTKSKKPLIDVERGAFASLAGGVGGVATSSISVPGAEIYRAYSKERQQDTRDKYYNNIDPTKTKSLDHVKKIQDDFKNIVDRYSDIHYPKDVLDDIDMQEAIRDEIVSRGLSITQPLESVGQNKSSTEEEFEVTSQEIVPEVNTNNTDDKESPMQKTSSNIFDDIDRQDETTDEISLQEQQNTQPLESVGQNKSSTEEKFEVTSQEIVPGININNTKEEKVLNSKKDEYNPMPNNPVHYKALEDYPKRPKNDKLKVGKDILIMPKDATYPSDVKDEIVKLVGNRIYSGNLSKDKLGEFRDKSGVIRLQSMNDVETMAHEVAHYLDYEKDKKQKYLNNFKKFKKRNMEDIGSYSYTSDKDNIVSEGFAELIRAYLTQSDKLLSGNKKLYNELELVLKSLGDKKYSQIKKIQAKSHFYINQGAKLMNKSAIAPHKSFKDRFLNFKDNKLNHNENITSYIDIAHPAKVIAKELGLDQGYSSSNPYIQFRFATGHPESVVEAVARYGTPKIAKNGSLAYSGESLSDVFSTVLEDNGRRESNNDTLDDLFRYFQMKQAKYQIEEEDKKTAFTLKNIEEELPELESRKGFKKAHKKWLDFNERMLNFYVDMNYLTKKQAESFKEKNPLYVPTHRVVSSLDNGVSKASGGGFKSRSKLGSDRTLLPVENIFTQIENQISSALIARAKNVLFSGIVSKQDGSKWASYIPTTSKKYKALKDQQAKHFATVMFDEGMVVDENGDIVSSEEEIEISPEMKSDMIDAMSKKIEENPELATFYSYGHKPYSIDGSIINIIINDKERFFEINKGTSEGRLLLNMLNGIDSTYSSNMFFKVMHSTKNLMTRTIVSTPNFILGNLFVDTTTAGVYSKTNFIPGVGSINGAKSAMNDDDDYKLFVLNGGAFGTRVEMATQEARAQQMMKLSVHEKSFTRMLNVYDRVVSIGEIATRVGEYKNAIKKGIDPLAAAYLGTEITTDFSMHGSDTTFNALRSTVAFLPASINSMYKDYREFTGNESADKKKHFFNFAIKGFTIITIPAILSMMSDDDDDRTVAEDARYSHYKIGDTTYRSKTQYLLGLIFEKAPKIARETFIRDNGEKAWKIAKVGMYSMLVPDATPTIASPILDLMRNERFTGAPIVPPKLKNRTGEASYTQYTDNTSLMYVDLAKYAKRMGINVSPVKMQYLTRGYLGYLSKYIEDSTNRLLWDKNLYGEMPNQEMFSYLTHNFVYKDYGQSYWNEQYYEAQDRVLQIDAEISALREFIIRDKGKSIKEVYSYKQKIAIAKTADSFNKINKTLSSLRKQSTIIRYDKKLTTDEKDKKLLELNRVRTKVLKIEFLKLDRLIKEYEKSVKG